MKGYTVALSVLLLFALVSYSMKPYFKSLNTDTVLYYWSMFTVLTGIWEFFYVTMYSSILKYAVRLKETGAHVWTLDYSVLAVFPQKTAMLFYAEYGAHADREYMSGARGDFWSRLIESSHALCCGLFCLGFLINTYNGNVTAATWLIGAGMGAQFMNSLLYMGQYFLECRDKHSPNYNSPKFPLGPLMLKRWFMWVNLAWLVFPAYILYTHVGSAMLLTPLALARYAHRRTPNTYMPAISVEAPKIE